MLNKFLLLISVFLICISFGCTSSQKATEYPQRYIDQPYTLPEDVDVWGTISSVFYERSNGQNYSWPYPIPVPLYWEHSVNENLTLEIPVIPIGLRWKISSDTDSELGLHVLWGFGYSTSTGFSLFPSASLFYKILQDKDHAFILSPSVAISTYAENKSRSFWNSEISFGYLIQLNDANAIQPNVIFAHNEFNKRSTIPLEIFYSHRIAPTWQFESIYKYDGIGATDYYRHQFSFIFKKYF